MESKSNKIIPLIIGISVGVCIMFAPSVITGEGYSNKNMGAFLVADMMIRSCTLTVGLLVVYDAVKNYFSKK